MKGFPFRPEATEPKPVEESNHNTWLYEPKRDARNVGLSREQCDAAFPDMYEEVNRAVGVWQQREHTISPADIDMEWRADAAIHVLIYDNQLRVIRSKGTYGNDGYRKRTLYVLSQINRALLGASAAGEKVPDVEFSITVDDISLIPGKE